MQTNFEKVSHFNSLIGNVRFLKGDINWVELTAQLDMIREEFEELEAAIANQDLEGLRDATADVLVTAYGMGYRAGLDVDDDMEEVNRSNLSKFCTSTEQAIATAAKYEAIQVVVKYHHLPGGLIAVISAFDQTGSDQKFYPKGKLLKSVGFSEPVFI